jgi:hypothetical protein
MIESVYEEEYLSGQPGRIETAAAANSARWQGPAAHTGEHWQQLHEDW